MAITSYNDVVALYDGASTQAKVEGTIRRAERSLTILVGNLATHDRQLVIDTVVDAVMRKLDNPNGFLSETDGDYGYTRLERGVDGFWWPADWAKLFGVEGAKIARTLSTPLSPRIEGYYAAGRYPQGWPV